MENIKMEDLKPGMQVRIVDKRQGHWNSEGEMDKWMGKAMTIETIRHVDDITMQEDTGEGYRIDDHWTWHLSDIAEIIRPESIHITRDGNTVHAVLKNGNEVVRKARADCHPDDTFDFAVGAKLAVERVLEEEKHTEEEKRASLRLLEAVQMLYPNRPYVVMDKNGKVFACADAPMKAATQWMTNYDDILIESAIPILSWDDTEPVHIPTKIEELRKELGE